MGRSVRKLSPSIIREAINWWPLLQFCTALPGILLILLILQCDCTSTYYHTSRTSLVDRIGVEQPGRARSAGWSRTVERRSPNPTTDLLSGSNGADYKHEQGIHIYVVPSDCPLPPLSIGSPHILACTHPELSVFGSGGATCRLQEGLCYSYYMQALRVAGGSASYARSRSRGRTVQTKIGEHPGDLRMPRAPCSIQENNPNVACMYARKYIFFFFRYVRKRRHSTPLSTAKTIQMNPKKIGKKKTTPCPPMYLFSA